MSGKRQVEARWGVKFWQLVSDFADQGLSRSDTARALGYRIDSFSKLLADNPQKDPFDAFIISIRYLNETGETLKTALERMAFEGRTWGYAARKTGYSDGHTLKRAAISRGWDIGLSSVIGRPRIRGTNKQKNTPFTTGWPSWERVYAMGSSK